MCGIVGVVGGASDAALLLAEGLKRLAQFGSVVFALERTDDLQGVVAHRLRQHPRQQAVNVRALPVLIGNDAAALCLLIARETGTLSPAASAPPHIRSCLHLDISFVIAAFTAGPPKP